MMELIYSIKNHRSERTVKLLKVTITLNNWYDGNSFIRNTQQTQGGHNSAFVNDAYLGGHWRLQQPRLPARCNSFGDSAGAVQGQ